MSRTAPAQTSGQLLPAHAVPAVPAVQQRGVANVAQLRSLPPPVTAAGLKRRHRRIFVGFFLSVLVPLVLSGWYLYTRAADQFSSTFSFSVHTEESPTGRSILGGLSAFSALSGSGAPDTDILFDFLFSQELAERVDARLDLRSRWSRPDNDPVFSYDAGGSVEDLTAYWKRMVRVDYDPGARIITVQVFAFAADDAHQIATAILDESSAMINALSTAARADTLRQAEADRAMTAARLKAARQSLTALRARTRIVDPMQDLQGEMGVLNQLQQILADELVSLDMLQSTVKKALRGNSADARITQSARKIKVVRARIAAERNKFGGGEGRNYAALLNEFEEMTVELEFAEQFWLSAVAAYETARAEAQRQTRYLAAHVKPTLPERALYPQRLMILGVIGVFLFLGWSVLTLAAYGLRDRK